MQKQNMQKQKRFWIGILISFAIAIFGGLVVHDLPVQARDRTFIDVSLDFINEYQFPKQKFENTPVGGLSGLAYDRLDDTFYAISDDRSEFAPARFYALKLKFNQQINQQKSQPKLENAEVIGVNFLKDKTGDTYPKGEVDTEGIALTGDRTVLISSEGVTRKNIPPFIDEFDLLSGKWLRSLPIPSRYLLERTATTTRTTLAIILYEFVTAPFLRFKRGWT